MVMSQGSQPRTAISARLVGRNRAGCAPAGFCSRLENKGVAVCTPAIRPDPSPYVDGNINLGLVALNQQGDAVPRPRHLPLEGRHRGDARSIDPNPPIPPLNPAAEPRP